MIRSFSDSIFNDKITLDEADKKNKAIYWTIYKNLIAEQDQKPKQIKRNIEILMKVYMLFVKVKK